MCLFRAPSCAVCDCAHFSPVVWFHLRWPRSVERVLHSGPSSLFYRLSIAPITGDSSSSWWEGWSGTYHGWNDSSSLDPTLVTQTTEEWTINAVHRLRDQLKQMTDLTKKRSHRTMSERTTSTSKGNDAYAALEAVIKARAQQQEAKRVNDAKFAEAVNAEEAYHDAISRTLEKTVILERHVKTVTMRADSLTFVEADFFQTLIERQEETIRELNTLYG